MFVFVIPLKAKKNASDWEATCRLLDRTLMSIEAQEYGDHRTLLVCTDRPTLTANLDKTTVIETDYQTEDEPDVETSRIDKRRKLCRGLLEARALAPDYVMFVDADDLLHRRLLSYVYDHRDYQGFLIAKGYRQILGQHHLRKTVRFHKISGSGTIFPFSAGDLPEDATEDSYPDHYMTAVAHNKEGEKDFAARNIRFRTIPFYAAIYIRGHGDSIRDLWVRRNANASPKKFRRSHWMDVIRKIIGKLKGPQPINDAVLHDFPGLER